MPQAIYADELGNTDISQIVLIKKIQSYLKKQGRDEKLAEGYCCGLAVLWGFYLLEGKEHEFFQRLKRISEWNEKEDIDTEFEKLFGSIEWLQRSRYWERQSYLWQGSINANIEVIKKTGSSTAISVEYQLSFLFAKEELINTLKNLIHPEKVFLLSSHNHAVSFFLDGKTKKYKFYDSNSPDGVWEFNTIEDLVNHKNGLIQAYIFENSRLNSLFGFKNPTPSLLPLSILIYDRSDKKMEHYREAEEIIKELVQARQSKNKSSKINDTAWENVTSLWMAAAQGNIECARVLISLGADVNIANKDQITPLHEVTSSTVFGKSPLPFIKLLVENGANVLVKAKATGEMLYPLEWTIKRDPEVDNYLAMMSLYQAAVQGNADLFFEIQTILQTQAIEFDYKQKLENGCNLLHAAARGGNYEIIEFLSNENVPANVKNKDNQTPADVAHPDVMEVMRAKYLHAAIQQGDANTIETLINAYPSLIEALDQYQTPLITAIKHQQYEIANILIDRGCNLKSFDKYGLTPLHIAIQIGNIKLVEKLMSSLSEINEISSSCQVAPLHLAASRGQLEIMTILAGNNANIKIKDRKGNTPLHHAAKEGHIKAIEFLIAHYSNEEINLENDNKWTALHYAVSNGHTEIVRYLIAQGANVNTTNEDKETPLHSALFNYRDGVIELICTPEMINAQTIQGEAPLHIAAEKGLIQAIILFIKHKAEIDTRDRNGETPLHIAAQKGDILIVDYLINQGADITAISHNGSSLIHFSAKSGSVKLIETLINYQFDINEQNKEGLTALHIAVQKQFLQLSSFLIANKADLERKDKYGFTALHYAVKGQSVDILEALINSGADPHATDNEGKTPLELVGNTSSMGKYLLSLQLREAILKQDVHLVSSFDPKEINVEITDKENQTLLHLATKSQKMESIKFLIEKCGANINSKNSNGKTALHIAVEKGYINIAQFLISKGANLFTKDHTGMTPLHIAAENGDDELVETLIQNNAYLHAKAENQMTPLHFAVLNMKNTTLKRLISHGAEVNSKTGKGKTALLIFLEQRKSNTPIIDTLLRNGSDSNDKSEENGNTLLHYAVLNNNLIAVKLLLHYNAKIGIKNKAGKTPLDIAKENNYKHIVKTIEVAQKNERLLIKMYSSFLQLIDRDKDKDKDKESLSYIKQLKISLEKVPKEISDVEFQAQIKNILDSFQKEKASESKFSFFSQKPPLIIAENLVTYGKKIIEQFSQDEVLEDEYQAIENNNSKQLFS